MTANTSTVKGYGGNAPLNLIGTASKLLAKATVKAKAILKTLQLARFMSTLCHLSDYQLAQIGITRSEIPAYAAKLLADE